MTSHFLPPVATRLLNDAIVTNMFLYVSALYVTAAAAFDSHVTQHRGVISRIYAPEGSRIDAPTPGPIGR